MDAKRQNSQGERCIKEGAVFIADAHENLAAGRNGFLEFLHALDESRIIASQLFLMGDMFDFLCGYADNTVKIYAEHIALINKIAQKIRVFYIEGNHDFGLAPIFKNVEIFPIQKQPANFKTQDENSVAIAHGDIFLPPITKYALLFLRLKWFLKAMNFMDRILNFKISNAILTKLKSKKLDYEISNFSGFIAPKMCHYEACVVIEGHYHQGKIFSINNKFYINLPAFACDRSFFVVEYANEKIQFARKSLKGH